MAAKLNGENERVNSGNGAPGTSAGQRLLASRARLEEFLPTLLATQSLIAGGSEGVGYIVAAEVADGAANLRPRLAAHLKPNHISPELQANNLNLFQELLHPCLVNGKDGAIEIRQNSPGPTRFALITLLQHQGRIVAVTAVIAPCPDGERAQQLLVAMQLAAGYLGLPSGAGQELGGAEAGRGQEEALQLIAAVAASEGFEPAIRGLCNTMALRSGASRASLGWVRGRRIQVRAISNCEKFDRKQELTVRIQRAMEECLDQEEAVHFVRDGGGSENITRESAALARAEGNEGVLSLPLRQGDEIMGIITLEFALGSQPGEPLLSALGAAAELLGPQLADRWQGGRGWLAVSWFALRGMMEKLLGPTHTLAKIVVILLGVLAWLVSPRSPYIPTYRVSVPFQFVPEEKRQLTAAFDGYLAEYFVRPGDRVEKGARLARLDTKELELQRIEAESQMLALQRQADAYWADSAKQAERQIALAERLEAQAHRDLLSLRIEMATLIAPMTGEILSGELRDRTGSPFKTGEVMLELADPARLLVELAVPDRDIQELEKGQKGWLATSSLPGDRYPFLIERIVPLGEARDGANIFKVYGRLAAETAAGRLGAGQWRPGMTGEARIEIGPASLFWQGTHRLADLIRLKTWL